jgi:hypothetical protein
MPLLLGWACPSLIWLRHEGADLTPQRIRTAVQPRDWRHVQESHTGSPTLGFNPWDLTSDQFFAAHTGSPGPCSL